MFKEFNERKKDLLKIFDRKIEIALIEDVIKNGRRVGEEKKEFAICYSRVRELYSTEFYSAMHEGLKDTLVFELRYFKKLEELRSEENRKRVRIYFDNKEYKLYKIDFLNDSREFVLLKVNRSN